MEAARGLQQLSGTVSDIGSKVIDQMEDASKLQHMHAEAEMTVSALEEEEVWKTNPENDINDQQYVANFTSNLEKRLERFANGFNTKVGRDLIGLSIRRQVAESSARIRKAQDDGKVAQIGRAYNETLIKYGNTLYQNPNMFVPILQKFTLMASTLTNINEAQRQQLMTDARTKLVQSAILGEAHVYGPEVALENLLAGTFDMYLDPTAKGQQITSLTNRIYTEKNRQKALLDEAGKANADSIVKNFWDYTLEGKDATALLNAMKDDKYVTVAEYIAARKHSNGETSFAESDSAEGVAMMSRYLHNFQHDDAYSYLMNNMNLFTGNTFRNYTNTIRQARRNEGIVSDLEFHQDRLRRSLQPGEMEKNFGQKMFGLARAIMQFREWYQANPNASAKEISDKVTQLANANREDLFRSGLQVGVDPATYSNEAQTEHGIEDLVVKMEELQVEIAQTENPEMREQKQDEYMDMVNQLDALEKRLEYFRKGN